MDDSSVAVRPLAIIEAKFDLEAKQNDIIDMLLTEIKDDNQCVYELNIEKYKKIYQKDTSNIYRDMKRAAEGFEKKGVKIPLGNKEVWYAWFTKITYVENEGKIELKIDPEFKSILTEVKQRISYDIGYTLNCISKYSKRLYYHLKLFEDTGWRIDNVKELCDKLKCPQSYIDNYGKFKQNVLNVTIQEINNMTDIEFDYEEIREKRKVVRLKFNIKNKNRKIELIEPNYTLMSDGVNETLKDILDDEDIAKVKRILSESFENKTKSKTENEIEYLKEKIDYLTDYPKTSKEGSSYIALLLSALKGDWVKKDRSKQSVKGNNYKEQKVKQLKFDNFEGRDKTREEYEALEKKLLGWDNDKDEVAVDGDV